MKNFYLTTVMLLLTLGVFAQFGQLPNGGFENWSDLDLYDFPTDWGNSNTQEFQGTATVIKSTDAQDGTYSCEMIATVAGPQDTIFGFVYHGYIGQSGPENGIPYTSNVDEVQYQYKCDLAPGDTLFVIAIRYIAGVQVGIDVVEAAVDTEAAWTSGSVTLSNGAQDELFIGFVLTNPFGSDDPTPGSWARVDNMSMHNAGIEVTNVPDPSFENWTNVTTESPDDWYTLNPLLRGLNLENAIKTTDANTGTFAVEMTTVEVIATGDTIASYISYGEIDLTFSSQFSLTPYDAMPTQFSGAYKYAPSGADQAFIQMTFFAGGAAVGNDIQTINATAAWQTFNSPLSILSQPDSISLIAFSGNNPGSVLKLDDLSLSGGDVGLDEFSAMNVDIYPNPATTLVMIKAEGNYSYSIVDLSGNVVMTGNNLAGAIELDINHLSSGAYFLNINNALGNESHKLIIE